MSTVYYSYPGSATLMCEPPQISPGPVYVPKPTSKWLGDAPCFRWIIELASDAAEYSLQYGYLYAG